MDFESQPHLVPANLVGRRFPRDVFGGIKIALVGYCPPPRSLEKYKPQEMTDQHFIHVSPDSVKKISFESRQFLSLSHIYGGPVSASTVEELAYYKFEYILAYGLAGGLGTFSGTWLGNQRLRLGDFFLVESAFAGDGTTPHYTPAPVVSADAGLVELVRSLWSGITSVRAFTGDAIYREDAVLLELAKRHACDVINLDSSHLYAAALNNNDKRQIKAIECGVVSDVAGQSGEWQSSLSVMLASQSSDGRSPLEETGRLVEFYIERLAAFL